jgi:outer membrane protein assembly factor BamB
MLSSPTLQPTHTSMSFKSLLPFTTTLLVSLATTLAENWPQFRGPSRQGVSSEKNVPLTWSNTSNVVWKTAIPGEGWSSPIVWEDRVFVTSATNSGQECRVLAIDAKTGTVLWDKMVFEQLPRRKEGRNTYASPTPATDGQRVYACFGDGSFVALNFAGDVLWTNRDYPFYSQHGLASSPILHGDLLIMARDGSSDGPDKQLGWQKPWDQSFVVALDTKTGKERWKSKRGLSRIAHSVPNIWEHDGTAELISEAGDVLQSFDPKTGERLWSSEVIGEAKVPSVVLGDGLAFTAGGWGGKETIKAFRLGGKGDLKETNLVWEQRKGMPKVPSMLYLKPYLFSIPDTGVAGCMKAETGEIIWQERIGGNFSASPVTAAGRIYLLSDEGVTTVIAAEPEFKVLAKNPLGEKVQASIAISQKRLFIRTEKNLFCIGEK